MLIVDATPLVGTPGQRILQTSAATRQGLPLAVTSATLVVTGALLVVTRTLVVTGATPDCMCRHAFVDPTSRHGHEMMDPTRRLVYCAVHFPRFSRSF